VKTRENTLSNWRQLARDGKAVGEFEAWLMALPEAARRTAIAWTDSNPRAAWAAAVPGPLAGVPFLVKDLYDIAGVPTRAGSRFLHTERPIPTADSALVRKFRELGAVPVAKTHLNEFAYGATGENPHYGDCFQLPHPDRLTGGSSSGSAWGVQAGLAPIGLGTDTGGSSRIPPAFCGLWGVRLAPGHWSITDVFPLAPSFDTAGWFTTTAADMAETLAHILGLPAAGSMKEGAWISLADLDGNGTDIDATLFTTAGRIAKPAVPHVLRRVREATERSFAAYSVIVAREALAVHSGFLEHHADDYDPAVLARLRRAAELTDSDEAAARATMAAVRALMLEVVAETGFIVMPVSPVPALTKKQCDPSHRERILRLNVPVSLAGLPALTIPVPLPGGLSGGLQVICPALDSPVLISVLESLR